MSTVGYVGADVPVELITAAGLRPRRLTGNPGEDSALGDRYLGRGVDPVARSVLTRILTGAYGPLEAIVVSRDCEASLRLFYALRELHRVEPELGLPPVRLVDVLHLPHHTTTRYVHAKIAQLREWLGQWRPITDDDLAAAITAHDTLRRSLGRLADLRRANRLSGTRFLEVVARTTALPVTEAIALVDGVSADPRETEGVGLFLTGSSHDGPAVYETLERNGFLVVGEDHDWGELLFARTCAAPTELALAERYQYNGPAAARASIRQRAAHTASAARACGAEILFSYARIHDDAPPWDFPEQRAATGLPVVLAERQPYGELTPEALAALVPAGAAA
ncbi:benzoyl-CoA reductase/2-hydroxyglutaryl-CoA dehydratase subunit BcrC/BadD/HgdB [Amycolatopsis lexingtonensis]|uniref:Benzoyl-CoA reductase/2-hydroxyglutaryl-CoA dehydratase subunit BcrC/BadD/HgdB n=1 Tax=Amycolatopsis lexingtonensis TaxID=218822 RepID=A0ABR9HY12_9PSEU|nr:2-hydroxyacyl-CoA dehydratase family protein [Amycolatopsis lexingtonensis]MBE1495788.1 benzoyl-CoA reductase/2-hydroxyglutaryl-CoA dehydratase subunit BcrC/BadD/HgdB [Amycolatopsis lexingtonensis]